MAVHFLRARELARPDSLDPFIGGKVFLSSFQNLADFSDNGFAMMGLFLLGVFFSLLYLRSGFHIYIVAGIHAGAVFIIKFNRVILDFSKKDWEWLFGTSTGIDSVAGWVILIGLIIFLLRKKNIIRSQTLS